MRKLVAMLGLVALVALPGSALAAHESSNKLDFAPVAGSATPDAAGSGVINYIKGTSGEEPDTAWSSSFRFSGLTAGSAYTVVVRGRFADATAFSAICDFTANATGMGACQEQFLGLQRLAIAQLRLGGAGGTPVLQATRQSVLPGGPGSITSDGGCRESDQGGSQCEAPGRS